MDKANKNKIQKISIAVTTAVFIVTFGFLITHGGWFLASAPTKENVSTPLNASVNFQTKIGGLTTNKAGESPGGGAKIGLLISDKGNPNLGLVGIGTSPSKKLDVAGNIGITGIIKPRGKTGSDDQLYTRTRDGNDWKSRFSWMSLMGMPSTCANPVGPQLCTDVGYKEYNSYCVTDPAGGSVTVRVCYKENF